MSKAIAACAAALVLACAGAHATKPIDHDIEVAFMDRLAPTDADIDRILADASALLHKKDSSDDLACPVGLKRKGALQPLAGKHPGVVGSMEDMAKLRELGGDLKIVREITWCGRPGSFLGCAGAEKGLMAVVPMDNAVGAAILWAHEFGHYKGLAHSSAPPERRVMLPEIAHANVEVDDKECEKLAAVPLPVFGLQQKLDPRILVRPSPARAAAPPLRPIREFVRRYWVHGVPYAEALRYDREAVPELVGMLRNTEERPFWSNVVHMIGLLGDREHVDELISFFRRGEGRLTPGEARAKSAVLFAVGYLQNRNPSPAGQAFLAQNSNPNQVRAPWLGTNAGEVQQRQREIARTAAAGLAFSGRPAEGARLADVQMSIQRGAFTLDTGAGEPHEYVDELRGIHDTISKRGLGAYLRGE
jgi:hypothetical protein